MVIWLGWLGIALLALGCLLVVVGAEHDGRAWWLILAAGVDVMLAGCVVMAAS